MLSYIYIYVICFDRVSVHLSTRCDRCYLDALRQVLHLGAVDMYWCAGVGGSSTHRCWRLQHLQEVEPPAPAGA